MTKVIAVVVSYRPAENLYPLLIELGRQCHHVIVVDNGSGTPLVDMVRLACRDSGSEIIELSENTGIAAAQNRGIARALDLGASHILLSDHDSLPGPDMVRQLLDAMVEDPDLGAVGPLVAEDRMGCDQLVYVARRWSPKRATPAEIQQKTLDVAFLIASGCLISVPALDAVGMMNEEMFIDHVDLEWGLRARRAGYLLAAVPGARLHHSLGDKVVHLPRRKQPVHVHAPFRNYYLMRNTIYLVKSDLMPWRWRLRYCYWAAKYAAFNAFMIDHRSERQEMLWRGLRDGILGRMGRLS